MDTKLNNLEKVPLLAIYKHNGEIKAELPDEKISIFELIGFLEVYIQELKDLMQEELENY